MKKRIAFFVLAALLLAALSAGALVGCAGITAAPGADATEAAEADTPEPTEEPLPPVAAVVGRNVSDEFLQGLKQGELDIISVDTIEEVESLGEADAIVLYLDSEEKNLTLISQAVARGIPVVAYNLCGQTLPEGVVSAGYNGEMAAQVAFEAMLGFPPHEMPVRLFGIFQDQAETNPAYSLWAGGVQEGKVLEKAVYSTDHDSVSIANWLTSLLETYFPGMMDAAFAETPDLAVEIVNKLMELGRDDLEVFTVGTNPELVRLAKAHPRIVPVLVGANDGEAGAFCAEALGKLLEGQKVENITLTAEAVTVEADDAGVSDGALTEEELAAETSPAAGDPTPEAGEATPEAGDTAEPEETGTPAAG